MECGKINFRNHPKHSVLVLKMNVDPDGSDASKYTFARSNQPNSQQSEFILEDGTDTSAFDVKSKSVTLVIAIFLGVFGVDWLYLSCGNTK